VTGSLEQFGSIVLDVTLPIFLIIGVGALLDRVRRLDLSTLAGLNFHVFVPALIFLKMLGADLSGAAFGKTALYALAHGSVMFLVTWVLFARMIREKDWGAYALAGTFYNAGNYGIPFAMLAFGDEYTSLIVVIMIVQNLVAFTAGLWVLVGQTRPLHRVLLHFFEIPVVWAVAAGLLLNRFGGDALDWMPIGAGIVSTAAAPMGKALDMISNGFVSVALLTLGVQLGRASWREQWGRVGLGAVVRLILSPLIAMPLVLAFGFHSDVAAFFIAAAGLPVAVNVFILCSEYHANPEAASRLVFWSTLLSALTLPLLVTLVHAFW